MLPAVVQEFVDHGAVLFKVYVIASEVNMLIYDCCSCLGGFSVPRMHGAE
jgi:hypothetical protein